MINWIEILIEILGLVLAFAVSSYFLFYKSWLKSLGNDMAKLVTREDLILIEENVKKNFNERLEELKSTLAKNNISHQIEFEFLHKRQAKVAVEIYEKLQHLHSVSFVAAKDTDKEGAEGKQKLHHAIVDFRDYFIKNKIFFPESFCKDINEILRDYWRKSQEYTYTYEPDIKRISEEINFKIPIELDKIEKRIRGILKIEE